MIAAETNNPMIPPAPAKPAQVPIALACCAAGKLVVMTDNVTGMTMAAANPAATRSAISVVGSVAKAAAMFVAANATRPMSSTGLRPHRSPMAPTGMRSAASASVYPLMIQSSWLCDAPRSSAKACWATLSPETDATTATSATHIAARISRRRTGSTMTTSWRSLGSWSTFAAGAGSGWAAGIVRSCRGGPFDPGWINRQTNNMTRRHLYDTLLHFEHASLRSRV